MSAGPVVRFYSFRTDAPIPHSCDRFDLHPAADPLCRPHIEALTMGQQMDSPLDWALTRTPDGMRVGWIRSDDTIDWQTPDELGNVYHPEGARIFDGFPLDQVARVKKIIVPGRGLQWANVKTSRPGLIEIISGWVFAPVRQGWGLRVGWPSGTPMPLGLTEVPHAFFRSWYQAPFPTVYHLAKIGDVVRFRRGDPMAAFVPLPDDVMDGNITDGRAVSAGLAEWPDELRARVAAVANAIYSRRGGYSSTAHRADRTGMCPLGHAAPTAVMPALSPKRLLAAALDDLDIAYIYKDEPYLLLLSGDRSSDVAAILTGADIPVVREPAGVRLPVGPPEQNARALAVLTAAGERVPRGARTYRRLSRVLAAQRTYEQVAS